jgi:hypothetical protein
MRASSSRGMKVVVGAHFQADNTVDVVRTRREHDDRRIVAVRAQPRERGQAVDARHHQVEHDDRWPLAHHHLIQFVRVLPERDREAAFVEKSLQQIA